MVLEKTLESPLDSKETNQSIVKEINPEYSFGRTDAEAEAPVFWPPDGKRRVIRMLILGKTEGKRKRGRQG